MSTEKIELCHDRIGVTLEEAGLVGVNAGPAVFDTDTKEIRPTVSKQYREMYKYLAVNRVRTHDFYTVFDLDDVYNINTGEYDFARTDETFRYIINSGAKLYLRIGYSYNTKGKDVNYLNNHDSRIAICQAATKIVSRYHHCTFIAEKQRDKFKHRVQYVEVWNEPDHSDFWPQDDNEVEHFVSLFYYIVGTIKKNYPELKVGGPGFTQEAYSDSVGKKIIDCMIATYEHDRSNTIDFLSWHFYSITPEDYQTKLEKFTSKVANPLGTSIHHISEWGLPKDCRNNGVSQFEAAALTACWIWMNWKGIHQAHFFRGIESWGVFNERYGWEHIMGYAFRQWSHFANATKGKNKLYKVSGKHSDSVVSWNVNEDDHFYGVGAYGKNCYVMLLANVSKKMDEIKGDTYRYEISHPGSQSFSASDVTIHKCTQGGVYQVVEGLDSKTMELRRNAVHVVMIKLK